MAVTRTRQVARLSANADALTGEVVLQGIVVTGTDFILTSDGVEVFRSSTGGKEAYFPCGLALRGITRTAGTGDCYLYLK